VLHTQTINAATFALLKQLMNDQKLASFSLAGETALSLYIGHRVSIDLDLFSDHEFDALALENYLISSYNFKGDMLEKNALKGSIEGVKTDFITHNYPRLQDFFTEEIPIRLYSMQDIAAMKLAAIADNGTRLKDFVDLAFLSTKLSLQDMLNTYQGKYSNTNSVRALKGLMYHSDINFEEPIRLISENFEWNFISKRLSEMIENENTVFSQPPSE